MTRPAIIIECGAAETRAALTDDRGAVKLWFGPARGDEALERAVRAGRQYHARVKRVERSLNAAFVNIGDGLDGLLPVKEKYHAALSEGALITVEVKAPPRQQKGALLKFCGVAPDSASPGPAQAAEDAAIAAFRFFDAPSAGVVCDSGDAIAALRAATPDVQIELASGASPFERRGVSADIASAFERVAPIPGGGRLIIDEAHALTAIDVDTAGLSASSAVRLREKIATAAATEAARQIILRRIGGHVAIDFPSINEAQARKRFRTVLDGVIASIPGAGGASFAKSGIFAFTVPHREQSLLDAFTEPATADPISGRRFTLDWAAKSALRGAEHRLNADHKMRLALWVGVELEEYLYVHPQWLARIEDRFGGRLAIQRGEKLKKREHRFDERSGQ